MDPAIKGGFAAGFAALVVVAGLFGWSQGWLPPEGDADRTAPTAESPPAPGRAPAEPSAPQAGAPSSRENSAGPTPGSDRAGQPMPSADPSAKSKSAAGAAPPMNSGDVAALSRPSAAPQKPSDGASPDKGVFDIVRVEPTGELVAAGRCPAKCTVELTANGRTIETASADAGGGFALTPPALPPGDHQLGLKVTGPDGVRAVSDQTVTVSVPAPPSKDVVVILNRPDAPSAILQQPGPPPSAAKPASDDAVGSRQPGAAGATTVQRVAGVALGAVDAENGRFFIQGSAPPGARLRVYLNNALIAEPVAGSDGRWSLRVERGLSPGRYVARIDQLDGSGKVASRAEQDFAVEGQLADATLSGTSSRPPAASAAGRVPGSSGQAAGASESGAAPPSVAIAAARPDRGRSGPSEHATSADAEASSGTTASPSKPRDRVASAATPGKSEVSGSASPDAANPVIASIDTAQVQRGDSLWRISRATYGRGQRYTVIFTANDGQIRNPDLIYPGQVLVLPSNQTGAADARPPR